MTDTQSRRPVGCALSSNARRPRLEEWRLFDADYLLETEDRESAYVASYAKVPDAEQRFTRLIEQESMCCAFADWQIQRDTNRLRLVVSGTREALEALEALTIR